MHSLLLLFIGLHFTLCSSTQPNKKQETVSAARVVSQQCKTLTINQYSPSDWNILKPVKDGKWVLPFSVKVHEPNTIFRIDFASRDEEEDQGGKEEEEEEEEEEDGMKKEENEIKEELSMDVREIINNQIEKDGNDRDMNDKDANEKDENNKDGKDKNWNDKDERDDENEDEGYKDEVDLDEGDEDEVKLDDIVETTAGVEFGPTAARLTQVNEYSEEVKDTGDIHNFIVMETEIGFIIRLRQKEKTGVLSLFIGGTYSYFFKQKWN
ncbi:major centromere autoantigen B isoform X1 [Eurytemora carolleeae]|uniref:major centromere autoantigen B isoform X1 n=1 Tax=Eurytemora carolleeae TaxID=1294199 RepID=UPI000C787C5B|nr:major centromere autoantigen B isoform X1 [Eurytemora carolleeae]|eukprot:XP_023343286.1 major centromere autoantigen B-like isoform X1 [Eurytemora affinis]